MNTPLLIDSIVRQVTVLLAQLGTAGGVRAPMAHVANQVFLHLAEELEAQGVSRKVSADMFGMALRAYVRKVARLREGLSAPGVTLWQAVLEFIREQGLVLRSRVLDRFSRDPEPVLLSILHDQTTPPPLDGCFGVEGVEVIVTDADGRAFSAVTNRAGNFYVEGSPAELALPYTAALRWTLNGQEQDPRMFSQPSYGGCASCHIGNSSPPTTLMSAPVIFLPGLNK